MTEKSDCYTDFYITSNQYNVSLNTVFFSFFFIMMLFVPDRNYLFHGEKKKEVYKNILRVDARGKSWRNLELYTLLKSCIPVQILHNIIHMCLMMIKYNIFKTDKGKRKRLHENMLGWMRGMGIATKE